MKVVKCINGHYFDNDRYQICPHCKAYPFIKTIDSAKLAGSNDFNAVYAGPEYFDATTVYAGPEYFDAAPIGFNEVNAGSDYFHVDPKDMTIDSVEFNDSDSEIKKND